MNTYVALLRGINVGGNNKLPMKELVTILEKLGLSSIKTYIQSGNVVFQSESTDLRFLSEQISAAIDESHGFMPQVFVLGTGELQDAIAANPFPEGEAEPKTLHLFFLDGIPSAPNLNAVDEMKADSERVQLIDKVFYLHAPDGIGRSKLAANVGKGWDVSVTARNWRTVRKVAEMAVELKQ